MALQKFWEYKYKELGQCGKIDIRNYILTTLYNEGQIQEKIKGMCWRNHIPTSTKIEEDILQNTFLEMSKVNIDELFLSFCDNPNRVLALSVTIAKLGGFSNLNDDYSHPNKSLAKKILFASNLRKSIHISTTEDIIMWVDDARLKNNIIFPQQQPEAYLDEPLFQKIRQHLNQDELEFLDFMLNNVFNKKYNQHYSFKLRKIYSFNEYRVKRIYLQNKIKDIIKKLNKENDTN